MAPAFYIDFGALDRALEPVVREVMAAAKPGKADKPDKAEQTAEETMVSGMLSPTVEHIMTRVVLDDLEGATVGWDRSDSKQRLACVRKLGYKLSDDNVLGGGSDNVFRATAADGSLCAVKVFRLYTSSYKPFGSVREEYDRTVRMSKLASDIGVGPKFHKAFTCQASFGGTYGVVVMDNVEGKVLREWLRPKPDEAKPTAAQKAKLRKNVEAAIEKMHGEKLFHNGLYRGNVLVTPSLTPLFLGYSSAKDDPKENSWSSDTSNGRHRDFDILKEFDDDDGDNRWENVETKELIRQVIAKAIERNIVNATFSQEMRTGASPARDLPQKLDQNSPAPQAQAPAPQAQAGGKGAKAKAAPAKAKAAPAKAKAAPAKVKPAKAKAAPAKAKAKPAKAKRAA